MFGNRRLFAMCLLAALINGAVARPAWATQVHLEYDYPTLGTIAQGLPENSQLITIGPGTELTYWPKTACTFRVDLSENDISLRIEQGHHGVFAYAAFNGIVWRDTLSQLPAIQSVTVDPWTNLPGFDQSRLWCDADEIRANFSGLPGEDTYHVKIDIHYVPEPSTFALLGIAALCLLASVRRRRKRVTIA